MSLAEPPIFPPTSPTFEMRSGDRWYDDLSVSDSMEEPCEEREEDEEHEQVLPELVQAAPESVQSKTLFHISVQLLSSEVMPQRAGRVSRLHRHRADRLRAVVSPMIERPEPRHPPADSLSAAEQIAVRALLAKAAATFESHKDTSPKLALTVTEFLELLKKTLERFPSTTSTVAETRTVLETFDGYVDSIEGESANVTLESRETGDVLYGEFPASDLLGKKISEQTRFLCETVKTDNGSRIDFRALPKIEVTDEEVRSIAEKMRGAFSSGDSSVIEY